jgi:hypothetical protein
VNGPSVAADQARGIPIARRPYGMTEKDVFDTVKDIAAKVREGSRTPSVRSLAGNALRAGGAPDGIRARTQVILDFVRSKCTYVGDPELVEFVQSARVTLCTPDAPICIPVGDCDDLVTATASLLGSIGIAPQLLVQDYGEEQEMHILIVVFDENGRRLGVDPSKKRTPVGPTDTAMREVMVDPNNPEHTGLSVPAGEFISVGRPKKPCCKSCGEGKVCTGCGSRVHPCPCETGATLGRRPMFTGLGAAPGSATGVDYTQSLVDVNAMGLKIADGDGYAKGPTPSLQSAMQSYQAAGNMGATTVGPEIDAAGLPSVTQPYTQQAWRLNQQLASYDATNTDATEVYDAATLAKSMLTLYQSAVAAAQGQQPAPPGNRSAVGAVITLSVIGGLLYVGWRYVHPQSHGRVFA